MTKRELAQALASKLKISRRKADFLVETFFEALKETLLRDGKVVFQEFGTFQVRELTTREIYHPGKKEKIPLPPRRKVSFRPARRLLERLNERETLSR